MGTYRGTISNDTITPEGLSPGVTADPLGTTPSDSVDIIEGADGADIISGGGGNDTISDANTPGLDVGNAGNVISGNGGSDEITIWARGTGGFNPVSNVAYGDEGNDSISLRISDFYEQREQDPYGEPPTGTVQLYGGAGADILSANTSIEAPGVQSYFYGDAGADTLQATVYFAEFDSRLGADNPDYLYGGDGNDTYEVREAQDVVIEEAAKGYDSIRAYDTDYTLPANVEELQLAYDFFPSKLQYRGIGNALSNNISAPQEGPELDQLSYAIDGLAGNDVVYGSAAAIDTLSGGAGDDTIYGKQAGGSYLGDYLDRDTARGGDGNDLIYGAGGPADTWDHSDTLYGDLGNDTIYGQDGDDTVYGGRGLDDPTDGPDRIYGDAGNDQVWAGGGDDIVYGGAGNEIHLSGQSGNDTLYGEAGTDYLAGGSGNDILYGGTENDRLSGTDGLDRLFGEGGTDTFDYDAVSHSKVGSTLRDVVGDFTGVGGSTRTEVIDLSTIDANTGVSGNQAFTFRGTSAFSAPGQIRVQASGTSDTLIQANVTGTSGAEMEILVTDGSALPTAWNALDFLL